MYKLDNIKRLDIFKEDQAIYEVRSSGNPPKERQKYRLIDLFAGAGGMTLGFSESFGLPI